MVFRTTTVPHPIQQLRDELDRVVNNVFSSPTWAGAARAVTGRGFPAVNLWEDENHYFVEAEVPGLQADNLEITVVGDELTIKGQRPAQSEAETAYHRRERGDGSFSRVIRLPSEVQSDGIQATLNDGVLLLTLPKAEAAKPKKIKVNTK